MRSHMYGINYNHSCWRKHISDSPVVGLSILKKKKKKKNLVMPLYGKDQRSFSPKTGFYINIICISNQSFHTAHQSCGHVYSTDESVRNRDSQVVGTKARNHLILPLVSRTMF